MKYYKIFHILTGQYVSRFKDGDYKISVELYKCMPSTREFYEVRMIFDKFQMQIFVTSVNCGVTIEIFDGNVEKIIPVMNEFDVQEVTDEIL